MLISFYYHFVSTKYLSQRWWGRESIPGPWLQVELKVSIQLHMCINSYLAQQPSRMLLLMSKQIWCICNKFLTYSSQQESAIFFTIFLNTKECHYPHSHKRDNRCMGGCWRFRRFLFQHFMLIAKAAACQQVACWAGWIYCLFLFRSSFQLWSDGHKLLAAMVLTLNSGHYSTTIYYQAQCWTWNKNNFVILSS